ncbi:MAG: holin family protein [bacterium]|nr:holin family protein [bacterium]
MSGFDPITAGINAVGSIIDKIWPDKNEAEKAKIKLAELAQAGALKELDLLLGQIKVNIEEAKHESVFVAGWRPFIGWVCGSALAYYYIVQPFLIWALSVFNIRTEMPKLDIGELIVILIGMLGLGAYRSYDKVRGNGK